jgi:GGDEF domain-containing protein
VICPSDVAGRVGDDYLVVLRRDCSEEQAVALCEQILELMQAPITVIDRQIKGGVAVGVALSESGEDLLRNAVAALEMTKESPEKEPFSIFRR